MKMENKISELLNKFYNGETTPEEEIYLREYFDNPEHDSKTAENLYFGYISGQQDSFGLSKNFETDFLKQIAETGKVNSNPAIFSIKPYKRKFKLSINYRYYLSAAAAAIIIFAGAIAYKFSLNNNKGLVITNQNYKENKTKAIAETESALKLIASKMNTAENEMNKIHDINKQISGIKKYLDFQNIRDEKDKYKD